MPAVTTVHVSRDIVWDDAAFAGLPQPIVLARNITLVGEPLPTTGHYPTVVSAVFRKVSRPAGDVCLPVTLSRQQTVASAP